MEYLKKKYQTYCSFAELVSQSVSRSVTHSLTHALEINKVRYILVQYIHSKVSYIHYCTRTCRAFSFSFWTLSGLTFGLGLGLGL